MITIKSENGHYTIYKNNQFQCTADTRVEAEKEKEELEKQEKE